MSADSPITLSVEAARRLHRLAVGLDADSMHTSVSAAIAHHGYVQIDPINVCGRMHDLILRNRVANYSEGDLMRFVHGVGPDGVCVKGTRDAKPHVAAKRAAFEHYLPGRGILVVFGADAWPHLRAGMLARASDASGFWGKFTDEQNRMADRVLAEIAKRGPLASDEFEDGMRMKNDWGGTGTLAKVTLDKLFYHGRLLIARRYDARRAYDLPERLLPASVLRARVPDAGETARWRVLLKLRQHRLVTLKKNELELVRDDVRAVKVEGCPVLYVLREDLDKVEAASCRFETEKKRQDAASTLAPLLLAPLDPLIYDRALTSKLWGFDYTWEVYVPQEKRVRGYYALPILSGVDFVGHIDPKADRSRKKLAVISRSLRKGHKASDALAGLARFLGLGK